MATNTDSNQSVDMKLIEVICKNKGLHKEIEKQYVKHKTDVMSVLNKMNKNEKEVYEDIISYVCVNDIDIDLLSLKVVQLGYVNKNIIAELLIKGWPALASKIKSYRGKELDVYELFLQQSNRHPLEYMNIFAVIMFFVNIYEVHPVALEEEREKVDNLFKMVTDVPSTFGKTTLYEKYKDRVDSVIKDYMFANCISGANYIEWYIHCFGNIPVSFELLGRIGRVELHNTCRNIKISKHELREILGLYFGGVDLSKDETESLENYMKEAVKTRLLQKAYLTIKKLYLKSTDVINLNAHFNNEEVKKSTEEVKELKLANKKLELEISKLRKEYKKGLEQEISKLQSDFDKLQSKYYEMHNRLISSEQIIDDLLKTPDEDELSIELDLSTFTIWLVGGNEIPGINWISGFDLHCDLSMLKDADYVFFNIVSSSHSARYRLFADVGFFKKIHYIDGTNEKIVLDKIRKIIEKNFKEIHI